jgi:hypothetical protein
MAKSMKVVHIGFPKTGTTFLQEVVFPMLSKDFLYFDRIASAPFFAPVIDRDDTIFDVGALQRAIQRAWGGEGNVLSSYEPLTGLHYRSGFVNRTLIATRLKALGFERVIITIRNQFDALESAYKQYVRSGGVLKFDDYVTFDEDRPRYLYPEYFDYCAIARLYAEKFGGSNVLILQYERLHERSFVDELARFLAVTPFEVDFGSLINPSLSYEKTRILRVVNHLTYSGYQPSHLISRRISTSLFCRQLARLPFLNGGKSFLTLQKRAVIAAFYQRSNQELREQAKIALTSDYP